MGQRGLIECLQYIECGVYTTHGAYTPVRQRGLLNTTTYFTFLLLSYYYLLYYFTTLLHTRGPRGPSLSRLVGCRQPRKIKVPQSATSCGQYAKDKLKVSK